MGERPSHLPLDPDEVATAIHFAKGDVPAAAMLLKAPHHRVARLIKASPRLTRILLEHIDLQVSRAASEYIRALDSDQDRRREWAAAKIMASRAAQSHPFAPAPPQPSAAAASLTLAQNAAGGRTLTFRWRTDSDDNPPSDDVASG